jgi:hypothetical protein
VKPEKGHMAESTELAKRKLKIIKIVLSKYKLPTIVEIYHVLTRKADNCTKTALKKNICVYIYLVQREPNRCHRKNNKVAI